MLKTLHYDSIYPSLIFLFPTRKFLGTKRTQVCYSWVVGEMFSWLVGLRNAGFVGFGGFV